MQPKAVVASNYTVTSGDSGVGTLAPQPDSVEWVTGNTYRLNWATGGFGQGGITVTVSDLPDDVTGQTMGTPHTWSTGVPVTLSRFEFE